MQTGQLILLLLLILVAAVVVVLVMRRSAAKREEQRVEAAGLRSAADTIAATMGGQAAYAQQAEERAGLARIEAEAKAREAARLEAEAAEQRAAAEATRREYETTMRRADDVDPDVKESAFAPVADEPTDAGAEPSDAVAEPSDAVAEPSGDAVAERSGQAAPGDRIGDGDDEGGEDEDLPMTRAERRAARDDAEGGAEAGPGWAAPAAAASVPAAGAVGAAAAGASAWASRDEVDPESERIASAADYRDDLPAARASDDVYPPAAAGSGGDMSDDAIRTEQDTRDEAPVDTTSRHADDALSEDVETPAGEWGGPRDEVADDDVADGAGVGIVTDPDAYAATEPVLAADQSPPVTREPVDEETASTGTVSDEVPPRRTDDSADATGPSDADVPVVLDTTDTDAYAATEPLLADGTTATDETDRSTTDEDERSEQDRFDPTPTRDWAADEGALLAETHDRGDRLGQERADLDQAADEPTGATASGEEHARRRVSGFDELRDGGFGVGSAAPIEGGAQPLDHPVQAYRDTMTFRVPGDPGYDSAEPDVWFYDEAAAERSGFRRSDG